MDAGDGIGGEIGEGVHELVDTNAGMAGGKLLAAVDDEDGDDEAGDDGFAYGAIELVIGELATFDVFFEESVVGFESGFAEVVMGGLRRRR